MSTTMHSMVYAVQLAKELSSMLASKHTTSAVSTMLYAVQLAKELSSMLASKL
jgi:hypothetical protein